VRGRSRACACGAGARATSHAGRAAASALREIHLKGNAVSRTMAGSRCAQCGREEFLPFRCRLCGLPHCLDHRMPENHACAGLAGYKARSDRDRVQQAANPEPEPVRVKVGGASSVRATGHRIGAFARRSATHMLLAILAVVFVAQVVAGIAIGLALGTGFDGVLFGFDLSQCALALGACGPFAAGPFGLASKPWAVVTNLVAHAGPYHILLNALFLYFIGLELERRVGRRALLTLFVGAGIVAAFAQVGLFGGAVLGASGGLMGLLGALTLLAPTMRVMLLGIFPMPLWGMTAIFVLLDVAGLFGTSAGIANLAHLFGLAIGLGAGQYLKRRGVLPRMTSWASQRRY
jgi:membrane associated rhomboid family serine protease